MVYGVTITMKPNEIAAIVLDVDPLKTRSCSAIWVQKQTKDFEVKKKGMTRVGRAFMAAFSVVNKIDLIPRMRI